MSQDKEREALRLLVEAVTAEVNEKGAGGYLLARLADARAALASQQAGQGEPVMWQYRYPNSKYYETETWSEWGPEQPGRTGCFEKRPLYASPPPREPLTEEQQLKAFQRFRHQWKHQQEPGNGDFFVAGIEAAEAHHGIHSREGGSK